MNAPMKHNVRTKRTRDGLGRPRTLQLVDANSATLGVDLLVVFRRNVARARRENRRLLGRSDAIVVAR